MLSIIKYAWLLCSVFLCSLFLRCTGISIRDAQETAYVNIIRHGEDLAEGGMPGPSKGLAVSGAKRAEYLARCMGAGRKSVAMPFGNPTALITVDISTLRPRMTLTPLATKVGLTVEAPCLEATPSDQCSATEIKKTLVPGGTTVVSLTRQIMYELVRGLNVTGHDEWLLNMKKAAKEHLHECTSLVTPQQQSEERFQEALKKHPKQAAAMKKEHDARKKMKGHYHRLNRVERMQKATEWGQEAVETVDGFHAKYLIRGECFDELWQIKLTRGGGSGDWRAVSIETLKQGFDKATYEPKGACNGSLATQ